MKKFAIAVLSVVMVACTTPPAPLKPGAVTDAPMGCKQGQVRGVEC